MQNTQYTIPCLTDDLSDLLEQAEPGGGSALNSSPLSAPISELRWLVDQLGQELDTLESTSRPRVHRFLMLNLTTRIVHIAAQVHRTLTRSSVDQRSVSNGAHFVEQSA